MVQIPDHVFPLLRRSRNQQHHAHAVAGSGMDRRMREETPTEKAFIAGICFGQIARRHEKKSGQIWRRKGHHKTSLTTPRDPSNQNLLSSPGRLFSGFVKDSAFPRSFTDYHPAIHRETAFTWKPADSDHPKSHESAACRISPGQRASNGAVHPIRSFRVG